jgi:hypothetical protein
MSSLKDLLKREAEEQRTHAAERASLQTEWTGAVDRLMQQLEGWLREVDPEGALRIESTTHRIGERRMGFYEAKGLRITLGSRTLGARKILVKPDSRDNIASVVGEPFGKTVKDGRVDMTNYEKRYMLFRRKMETGDEWVILDDRDYRAHLLDREQFEAAIQSMLE